MPLRSSAFSIRDLIRNLTSSDRSKVQSSRARLTILGGRVVEPLIGTLEGGNDRLKLMTMPILALIRDRRSREPLIAMLRDRDPKIREVACRSLSQFPCRDVIVCLERVVKDELRADVRVAALQSLIAMFDEGHDEALREPLSILFDADESRRVRLTALGALPFLSLRERRGVLKKLRADPDEEIASRALGIEEETGRTEPEDPEAPARMTQDLASSNHQKWNEALHRLIAMGSQALPILITAMRARHRDPEFASRASMVLKGLGPRRLRAVADHLDSVLEPLPLEVLVDVVASLDDRPLTYRLKNVIESLDARAASVNGFAGPDPYARVRGKAHLALARLGSRVAIADIKKTLSDPARRVDGDLLTALARVGTRDELPDLLRAYRREDHWIRGRIRDVFWQIVTREKIRRGGAPFQTLAHQDRDALRSILEERGSQRGPTLPGLKSRPRRSRSSSSTSARRTRSHAPDR